MSAVFEHCDFRGTVLDEVMFDGRDLTLGKGRPNKLGENQLFGCDFSTAALIGTSFIAIDFRYCTVPIGENFMLIDQFPHRCRDALATLATLPARMRA